MYIRLTFREWWVVRYEGLPCGGEWAWAERGADGAFRLVGCVTHLRLN